MLIGTILFGLLVLGTGTLLLKSKEKASIFAVVVAVLTLQYTDIFDPIREQFSDGLDPRTISYVVFPALVLISLIPLRRLKAEIASKLVRYLAVVGVLLVLFGVWNIASKAIASAGVHVTAKNEDLRSLDRKEMARKPDIYFLVFDRYTGSKALLESFNFDNSKFLDGLRDREFYVADSSFSNYPTTYPSLASSLNAGELKVDGDPNQSAGYLPLQQFYEKPAVAEFLKKQGYSFVQVGSWWQNTNKSSYADENPLSAWEVPIFGTTAYLQYLSGSFLKGTLYGSFYEFHGNSNFSHNTKAGEIFLSMMGKVCQQARSHNGPKFVFMHALMPHPPLVFDSDGSRTYPPRLSDSDKFVRQTQFTNREITKLVDQILAANKDDPPIIILTADEGEYPPNYKDPDFFKKAKDADLRRKTNILAAFYFPRKDYVSLYHSITPVNIFRVVFNQYFGTGLELQPDRTRIQKANRMDWMDVTGRVRRTPGPPGSAVTKEKSSIGDF